MSRCTPWLARRRGDLAVRRRAVRHAEGCLAVEQELLGSAPEAVLATGRGWFVSWVLVERGTLSFLHGLGSHGPHVPCFVLYVPPHSIVRMELGAVTMRTLGCVGVERPGAWPESPVALPCSRPCRFDLEDLVSSMGRASACAHGVSADIGCARSIVGMRTALAEAALAARSVGRIAEAFGWSAAGFSRAFARAYGLTPRQYVTRVRIHDAAVALLRGVEITEVAFSNGYNDLSGFYRQFQKTTGLTPGCYRAAVKKVQDAEWGRGATSQK